MAAQVKHLQVAKASFDKLVAPPSAPERLRNCVARMGLLGESGVARFRAQKMAELWDV